VHVSEHDDAPTRQGMLAPAIRLGRRSSLLLAVTTAFGVVAFGWPLMIHQHSGADNAHGGDAPWVFVALVPLLLGIVIAELSEGAIDAKAVALLGILAACFAALRVPSPGINGFEPEWFLLVLSARVFGRGFGFVLGAVAFFASALATGGVGPWLPFQMLAAAWVGFGAGCLPPLRGLAERVVLAGYGAAAALAYGLIINFWFWPFVAGATTRYSFVPGLGVLANLHRFVLFDFTTSLGFDLTRAATTAILVLVLGRPVLAALRRTSRRAVFEPMVEFSERPL
jgi:energy-coupling factor transport system substrate-specific component